MTMLEPMMKSVKLFHDKMDLPANIYFLKMIKII